MTAPELTIFAAGSLRNLLPALIAAFSKTEGIEVRTRHGPAGLLRERIEAGDRPDLFLSADVGHPIRLGAMGLAGPTVLFARNRLAALARRGAGLAGDAFLDRLLDPSIRIGTSKPLKDPSGDYAWALFRRIDGLRPGAFAVLDAKAQKLVGGIEPTASPAPYSPVAAAFGAGQVDVFFGYSTGLKSSAETIPEVEMVDIPEEVAVRPEYGAAVLDGGSPKAMNFVIFMMSLAGQQLVRDSGFEPVALSVASVS